jgi:hypothetical protein
MKFFDSKEEVLDIQLTQYGRHLLSKSIWKPVYYAFFDENILYDGQYGGLVENQNPDEDVSAEVRIQDETPLLRTQYSFTGRDEYLFDGADDETDRVRLSAYEKLNVMPMSLGTTALDSTKTPAFNVQFLEGEIDSLEYNLTGSTRTFDSITSYSQQLLKIPQIESDIEFKITVVDPGNSQVNFEVDPALSPPTVYSDGFFVVIGPEQLLLLVEEKNTTFDYENFDIEIFEITDEIGGSGEQVMNQLSFVRPLEMVENNILIDREEAELKAGRINGQLPTLDPTYVEYYFNVNVDTEINENQICKSVSSLSSKNILVDTGIECPDLTTPIRSNIYYSDAEDEDCPDN